MVQGLRQAEEGSFTKSLDKSIFSIHIDRFIYI
jgi:hypothetical protein